MTLVVRAFLSSLVATLLLTSTPAGAAPEDNVVGRWGGSSSDGKVREVWTIINDGGVWGVSGEYFEGERKVGGFKGEGVVFSRGALRFRQVFYRLPVASWARVNTIVARNSGDDLVFDWNTGAAKGQGKLRRLRPPMPPAPPLVGTWRGKTGDGKFQERWEVTRRGDAWAVVGTYFSGNRQVGRFEGQGLSYADGKLRFKQVFTKLPDPTWARVNHIVAWASGNTLNFDWNTGKDKGRVTLRRLR